MTRVAETVQHRKVCVRCGADVAETKRFKDADGHYYCTACYQAAQASGATANAATVALPDHSTARALGLLPTITCPHCWAQFSPSQVLWVAQHSDLHGDPVLGPEKAKRFLPTRFTPHGQAIDSRGAACQLIACPRCHLIVPRSVIELAPLFLSVIGGPKSGKSYFLACMTWELRRTLPSQFGLSFSDADTISNQVLTEYEGTLFLAEDPQKLVAIRKTELEGELYDQINLGGQVMSLPRPFLFDIRPAADHPHAAKRAECSRMVCMYDNAGEHFQPGMDRAGSPVTMHLARSRALMFLFDPTQDPRFRELCKGLSNDPQLNGARNTQRQETLLTEASLRVRRYANLPPNTKHQRPLIVVVPKSDVWGKLLEGEDLINDPFILSALKGKLAGVDTRRIDRVSRKLRSLLAQRTPELVSAAEDFCEHVVYIPVSSLGCSPEEATLPGATGTGLFVRPSQIGPRWASVPVVYMLSKWASGLLANNDAAPQVKGGR
jgi:hypothetical protein